MKNIDLLNCYDTLNNIANRSDIKTRFEIAKKCQCIKPHYDAIEESRVGLVKKYADKDGKKVDENKLPQFQKEYEELLLIDAVVSPFISLDDVQKATMQELVVLKEVVVDGEYN